MNIALKLFRFIASGHLVRPADKPDEFGVPGLTGRDVDFILGERNLRRHDELMEQMDAAKRERKP